MFSVKAKGGQLQLRVMSAVVEVAHRIFAKSQQNLVEPIYPVETKDGVVMTQITDTGFLLQSGILQHEKDRSIIHYSAPYAADVEFGQSPGKTPNEVEIKEWAERKLGLSESEARAAAKNIAWHIYHYGTQPRPFLRDAVYSVVYGGRRR